MKVMTVRGTVTAQYSPNCGVVPTPMLFVREVSTSSQVNKGVENNADMKLPGRKNIVTTARVFIDAASRWLVKDMFLVQTDSSRLLMLSFCEIRLKSWGKLISPAYYRVL